MSTPGGLTGPLVQAVIGADQALAGALGDSPAPVPSVHGGPRRIAAPRAWSAPDAGAGGHVAVHRDVLRGVAARMRSDLGDLDEAVGRLTGARSGGGVSISGNGGGPAARWVTAVAFDANASGAYAGVLRASRQAGDAHQDTSRRLADSAATYDDSEADNVRAIRGAYSAGTYLNAVTGMVASYGRRGVAAPAAVPRYAVKKHAVTAFSGAGMSAAEIMSILHGLDPGAVQDAGAAHTTMGNTLNTVAERLAGNAHTLARNWSGAAAQGAMGQFQRLHDHMVTLGQQALQVGSVLTWLGKDVLPRFRTLPDPSASGLSLTLADAMAGAGIGVALAGLAGGAAGGLVGAVVGAGDSLLGGAQAAADHQARQYIARLSGYLVTANQALPAAIGGTLVARGSRPGRPGSLLVTGASSGGAGAAASAAVSGATGVTGVTGPAAGGFGALGLAVGATGGGVPGVLARLQSASGPAGTGSPGPDSPAGAGAVGSSTAGPSTAGPSTAGPGAPGFGAPIPGAPGASAAATEGSPAPGADGVSWESLTGVPGVNDVPVAPDSPVPGMPLTAGGSLVAGEPGPGAMAPGAAADSAAADSAAAEGAAAEGAAPGMAGFPMMGAGTAQPERDRKRHALLDEDADIWGQPAGLVPPLVEG